MIKSRRRLLLYLLWFVPAFLVIRYLSPKKTTAGGVDIPLERVPFNGAYLIRDKRIGVINKEGEISAISISCTHLGCTLNAEGENFVCPCHGSVFSHSGKVLKGPASADLRKLRHEINGEVITVYV